MYTYIYIYICIGHIFLCVDLVWGPAKQILQICSLGILQVKTVNLFLRFIRCYVPKIGFLGNHFHPQTRQRIITGHQPPSQSGKPRASTWLHRKTLMFVHGCPRRHQMVSICFNLFHYHKWSNESSHQPISNIEAAIQVPRPIQRCEKRSTWCLGDMRWNLSEVTWNNSNSPFSSISTVYHSIPTVYQQYIIVYPVVMDSWMTRTMTRTTGKRNKHGDDWKPIEKEPPHSQRNHRSNSTVTRISSLITNRWPCLWSTLVFWNNKPARNFGEPGKSSTPPVSPQSFTIFGRSYGSGSRRSALRAFCAFRNSWRTTKKGSKGETKTRHTKLL